MQCRRSHAHLIAVKHDQVLACGAGHQGRSMRRRVGRSLTSASGCSSIGQACAPDLGSAASIVMSGSLRPRPRVSNQRSWDVSPDAG